MAIKKKKARASVSSDNRDWIIHKHGVVTLQILLREMARISCAIFSNGVKNTLNRVTKFNNQQISCHYD